VTLSAADVEALRELLDEVEAYEDEGAIGSRAKRRARALVDRLEREAIEALPDEVAAEAAA
jgi:hypothetical protein